MQNVPDYLICPGCGEPTDNGHDRCLPPNAYYCSKCMKKDEEQALIDSEVVY